MVSLRVMDSRMDLLHSMIDNVEVRVLLCFSPIDYDLNSPEIVRLNTVCIVIANHRTSPNRQRSVTRTAFAYGLIDVHSSLKMMKYYLLLRHLDYPNSPACQLVDSCYYLLDYLDSDD